MYCVNPECPDYVESGIRGEYVDGVTVCPICGAYLAETILDGEGDRTGGSPGAAHPEHDTMTGELTAVASTSDPTEMTIIRSILDGAEIRFVVEGEERFSALRAQSDALRFNPLAGEVVFLVGEDDAELARALLTEGCPGDDWNTAGDDPPEP